VKRRFTFSLLCIGAASMISSISAVARPYSDAERKAMFVRAPAPDYPYDARRRKEEGTGLFRVYVDERGKVTGVTIIKSTGHQALDAEGLRTLKAWLARPGERREVDVPLHFLLSGSRGNDNGMGKDGLGILKSRDR
jgi:TonB family protein